MANTAFPKLQTVPELNFLRTSDSAAIASSKPSAVIDVFVKLAQGNSLI